MMSTLINLSAEQLVDAVSKVEGPFYDKLHSIYSKQIQEAINHVSKKKAQMSRTGRHLSQVAE